jgi:hypothetical protein
VSKENFFEADLTNPGLFNASKYSILENKSRLKLCSCILKRYHINYAFDIKIVEFILSQLF